MSHTTPPRTNLRAHLRWRTLDPLRARIREFLQHRCGDAHLADDLSQETFVRALFSGAAVERFDRPEAWLIHVAMNGARDHVRRSWARPAGPISDVLAEELVAPSPSPAALEPDVLLDVAGGKFELDWLALVLPRVWCELSLRDRQVLSARYFQGRTVKDIAQEHGARPETAKVWLYRARGRLRTRIERFVAGREAITAPGAGVALASACADGRRATWGR